MERATDSFPLISIIIPAYNAEKHLSNCIESILVQNFTNLEIIIINDGSVDNTETICKIYSEQYPFINYLTTSNHGASSARNSGLDIATGEYVMFVDSDDCINCDCLTELYQKITENNADVILSGITIFSQNTKSVILPECVTIQPDKFWHEIFKLQQNTGLIGYVSNKLYKKSVLDTNNIRFDTSKAVQEDLQFALNVLQKTKRISFVNKSYYDYFYIKKEGDINAIAAILDNLLTFSTLLGFSTQNSLDDQKIIFAEIQQNIHIQMYMTTNLQSFKKHMSYMFTEPRFLTLYKTFVSSINHFYDIIYKLIISQHYFTAYIFMKFRQSVSNTIQKLKQ